MIGTNAACITRRLMPDDAIDNVSEKILGMIGSVDIGEVTSVQPEAGHKTFILRVDCKLSQLGERTHHYQYKLAIKYRTKPAACHNSNYTFMRG